MDVAGCAYCLLCLYDDVDADPADQLPRLVEPPCYSGFRVVPCEAWMEGGRRILGCLDNLMWRDTPPAVLKSLDLRNNIVSNDSLRFFITSFFRLLGSWRAILLNLPTPIDGSDVKKRVFPAPGDQGDRISLRSCNLANAGSNNGGDTPLPYSVQP
jgi:hypothetical protein